MATRRIVLTEAQFELVETRKRLRHGIKEARAGDLAKGSGEDAIRRAFKVARDRS
tara:strand:- start:1751 stop:1915 length:165 start_codon:yes stop_codon:yes gene_type:complete